MINEEIRDAINRSMDREDLKHLIYKKGVKTLFQDGLIKVMEGITDLKEVFRLVDYDDYDEVSEELLDKTLGIDKKEETETSKIMDSMLYTNPEVMQTPRENKNQINETLNEQNNNYNPIPNQVIDNANSNETNNTINTNDNNINNVNNQNEINNNKQNIVNIPNLNVPNTPQTQIEEPTTNNQNIFTNNEGNLFDDNIFNSLRINENNNQQNNYTESLLQNINNDTNI